MLVFACGRGPARARAVGCRASCAWGAACASAAATSRCSRCSASRCRGRSGCSTSARTAPAASCRRSGWPAVCSCSSSCAACRGKPLLERYRRGHAAAARGHRPALRHHRASRSSSAGPIEEEMLAIACKLAQEQDGERVLGVNVVEVPLSLPLDAPIERAAECARRACASCRRCSRATTACRVDFMALRSRAISGEVARVAREADAGLILVGAVPHIGAQRRPGPGVLGDDREPAAPRALPRDRDVVPARHRKRRAGRGRRGRGAHPARTRARRLDVGLADTATGRRAAQQPRAERDGDEQRRDAHADVERAQVARRAPAGSRPSRPTVIEAIAIARPVMPTRACRCAGACRWRSPIAVVKLTHCARLSTIQIASTSQNAVEAASASTASAADDDARRRSRSTRRCGPRARGSSARSRCRSASRRRAPSRRAGRRGR